MWLSNAALKNPLCEARTVLCAENCVMDGPTCSVISGAPEECVGVVRLRLGVGRVGIGHGPNDNHARYNEYMWMESKIALHWQISSSNVSAL